VEHAEPTDSWSYQPQRLQNGLDKLRKTKMGFFMDWSAKPYTSLAGLSCWWGHTRWVTKWVI